MALGDWLDKGLGSGSHRQVEYGRWQKNPLRYLALGAALAMATDLYYVFSSHRLTPYTVIGGLLNAAFLVFYVQRRRSAWFAILLLAFVPPVYWFNLAITSPHQLPSTRVICAMAFVWLGVLAFLFAIRNRYYSYLKSIAARQR
jgi:hypothetical protein